MKVSNNSGSAMKTWLMKWQTCSTVELPVTSASAISAFATSCPSSSASLSASITNLACPFVLRGHISSCHLT